MLNKTIVYENPFTGEEQSGNYWFHISKADMARMEVEEHREVYVHLNEKGEEVELTGMIAKLQRIVDAEDGRAMMPVFEDIIRRSYGVREGDKFMRSDELWDEFRGSGAFDELLFELCTNAEKSAEFINGIVPNNLKELAEQAQAEAESSPAPNREQRRAAKKTAAKKKPAAKTPATPPVPFESSERSVALAEATTDNPIELTQEELVEMDPSDLQTGLAGGKFRMPGTLGN